MSKDMINKKKLLIVFFVLAQASFCVVHGQQSLQDKFKSYTAKAVHEKIYAHTDKEAYVAGEILWFKLYYVEADTHRPLQFSKLAYVELINEKGESVLQSKLSLDGLQDNGSFYLPTSLATGNYVLRAYTSWMKNFGSEYFFEKKIAIINTLTLPEKSQSSDTLSALRIDFFPEGGTLVKGIKSRLGFLAANRKQAVSTAQGFVIDNRGDTAARFSTAQSGMGSFDFLPEPEKTYTASVTIDGQKLTQKLPQAADNGYVLTVRNLSKDKVEVQVQRKRMQGENEVAPVLLAVHTRKTLFVAETKSISDNGTATFSIDKSRIGKGVIHFTLFNSNNQPLCERLIFEKPDNQSQLQIITDKKSVASREGIDLSLLVEDKQVADKSFSLSASVYKLDTLQNETPASISAYMWLSSELGADISNAAYYFSDDASVPEATENLMLTYGWRKFRWDNVLNTNSGLVKYFPEINSHIVTARMTDSRDGKTVPQREVYLSITGKRFGFYTAKTDANGIARFEVKDLYGNKQMIAQPAAEEDSMYKVEILKPFADEPVTNKYSFYPLSEKLSTVLLQRNLSMQVQNIYAADSMRNFVNPDIPDTLPFYAKPETAYELDLYKRFTTMEEVLREYVAGVNVVTKRGGLALKVFNPDIKDFYSSYPLVMVDGVPLQDVNKIFSYDPLKVRKLDVIQSRYVYGSLLFSGIISFITYDGEFDAFELSPKVIAIDYAGLQLQREFYSPQYNTEVQRASRLPDFRTTLFWKPDIKTDKEGKASLHFFSSDSKGRYIVIAQGINEKGELVNASTSFEVK